jgi:membrane fusion protein, multidrug efflux system
MLSRLPVVFVLAGALAACGHQEPPPAAGTSPSGPIQRVEVRQVDDLKPVPGMYTTYKIAEATARLSGVLADLRVREGDMVRKGQVIGWVEDRKIGQQTSAYNAQAAAAEAQAVQAKAHYNRVKTLVDKGIYAQAALDQAEADFKAAEANIRAARAQAAASGAYGNEGAIVSPDNGRILRVPVPKGAVVMMGQSVATVTSGEPLVRIELPEAQGRTLKTGDSVRLSSGERMTTGTITQIYPSATQGQIVADVTPAGLEDLLIGARVTAYVRLGHRQAILLPRDYIQTRYGLDYVRLAQGNGSVLETTVETAPYDNGYVEVIGGLNNGDRVAAYGGGK